MTIQAVDLLMEYENTISKLYMECANQFPEHVLFWKKLSSEEDRHASTIKKLLQKVDDQTVFLEETRFKIRPLEISIEYAEEVAGKVKKGALSLIEALSIAYSIESSLLETDYYELFAGDSVSLNHYLKKLQEESADHRNRLKDKLEKVRQDSNLA